MDKTNTEVVVSLILGEQQMDSAVYLSTSSAQPANCSQL